MLLHETILSSVARLLGETGMRPMWLGLLFVGALGASAADARPNSTRMTCAKAAGMVALNGAVVMEIGPASHDRFVASRAFCANDETIEPAYVPTTDNPKCMIGYRCRLKTPYNRGR